MSRSNRRFFSSTALCSSKYLAIGLLAMAFCASRLVAQTWVPTAILTAPDGQATDVYGQAVAVSGDSALIGAFGVDGTAGTSSGAAYVLTRAGTNWVQQAKLEAADAAMNDFLGFSVALSGDTAVVGAQGEDAGGLDAGAAYVFTRTGTVWTQQQKLTASDAESGDNFGFSVAVLGDTILVGAPSDDGPGGDSGSAYVFTRSGTVWSQQTKLVASDATGGDFFGYSVALDGTTAVVGGVFSDGAAIDSGAAYVFTGSGATWAEQAKIASSDGAGDDRFGGSVSISGDTVVAGAYLDDMAAVVDAGSAVVFTRSGTVWTEQQKLTASDASMEDYFGTSVSVLGNTVLAGASQNDDDGLESGSAYVLTRSAGVWSEVAKLTAPGGDTGDRLGFSVAISTEAEVLLGAPYGGDGGADFGGAYVFGFGVPSNASAAWLMLE